MNTRKILNVGFLLLIMFLYIGARNERLALPKDAKAWDFSSYSKMFESKENYPKTKSFDEIPKSTQPADRTISLSTAQKYVTQRPLNGTELLELDKLPTFNGTFNRGKKVIVYPKSANSEDFKGFVQVFAKTKAKYTNNAKYKFVTRESLWNIDENSIKNSHDRVIYQLKKDCGLFCIFDSNSKTLIRLNGSNVNRKGAEIMDVILNSL